MGLIGSTAAGTLYDIVDMESLSDSVLNHSFLFGGYNGFNCIFSSAMVNAEVYDSTILHSANDGLLIACPNGKFQRNVISTAGADDIYFTATQGLVAGNVIEQATGNGVNCTGGNQLGVVGNYFDNNGKITPPMPGALVGQNMLVNNCQAVSISGNQLHRSNPGGESVNFPTDTAQVMFAGVNDSVSMAANVDYVGNTPGEPAMRPDYDVEFATPGTVVTNFSYADSPTPQNKGVFGPNAMAAIGPLQASEPQNFLTGLVTSNAGASAE